MTFRGVIVDLDGTVYRGRNLLPGGAAAIEALRERGCSLLFFSNNPTKSRADYVEYLADMGITVKEEEVLSSGTVTTTYLAEHHGDARIFVVGSSGLRAQFDAAGLHLTEDPEQCEVVIGSFYRGFDYDTLRESYVALDDGAHFIGTDPDVVVPAKDGVVPGSGAIINAMAGIAGRDPDRIMGKPSTEAARTALEALGTAPAETLVVGDRLDTDIALGDRAGATTVLVCTGVTGREDLTGATIHPDHVIDSLAEIETVIDS